jgi:alkanesulfonate monooxygenase SsuD/methylene tetrahydromethanopterin reductase-like flavin-dependent oxidoreductase (luciferase family)
MAAFAAASDRVRLGQMCTCMAYREPTHLAKIATTVDHISGGRIEMGIGAGWYEHEWRAYGFGFPTAGERINALDEGVQIMRAMWHDGDSGTFTGKRYKVDGALNYPQPLQTESIDGESKPHIPLWIAGGGEKKTLRVVAKYAQYANISPDPEGFTHKSEILRGHCEAVGRDFSEITRSANYNVLIGETQADIDAQIAWLRSNYEQHAPDHAEAGVAGWAGGQLVGTPEIIIERLKEMEALGMTYGIFSFPNVATDRRALELFEQKVIPAFR